MPRKFPRLIDMIATPKDRAAAKAMPRAGHMTFDEAGNVRTVVNSDGSLMTYSEPVPIDLNGVIWPTCRSSALAQDQTIVSGETHPIAD